MELTEQQSLVTIDKIYLTRANVRTCVDRIAMVGGVESHLARSATDVFIYQSTELRQLYKGQSESRVYTHHDRISASTKPPQSLAVDCQLEVSGGIVLLTSSVLYIGHLSSSSVACTKHCLQPINWLQQVVTTMFTGKFLHSKLYIALALRLTFTTMSLTCM